MTTGSAARTRGYLSTCIGACPRATYPSDSRWDCSRGGVGVPPSDTLWTMKRTLTLMYAALVLLAGCTHGVTSDTQGMVSPTLANHVPRVDVYEPLIRHLADPDGLHPIYITTDLCFVLMPLTPRCPDRLRKDEQTELRARLRDLGTIVFLSTGEPLLHRPRFQAISLSPIAEMPDGLRVEGDIACGNTCGTRTTYILVPTSGGYVVTGTDETFGVGVA